MTSNYPGIGIIHIRINWDPPVSLFVERREELPLPLSLRLILGSCCSEGLNKKCLSFEDNLHSESGTMDSGRNARVSGSSRGEGQGREEGPGIRGDCSWDAARGRGTKHREMEAMRKTLRVLFPTLTQNFVIFLSILTSNRLNTKICFFLHKWQWLERITSQPR